MPTGGPMPALWKTPSSGISRQCALQEDLFQIQKMLWLLFWWKQPIPGCSFEEHPSSLCSLIKRGTEQGVWGISPGFRDGLKGLLRQTQGWEPFVLCLGMPSLGFVSLRFWSPMKRSVGGCRVVSLPGEVAFLLCRVTLGRLEWMI